MFHTALYKAEVLDLHSMQVAIESELVQLEHATSTLDRIYLARESFSQIPLEHINSKTLSLLTSNFIDLDKKFIPELASKSLESAYAEQPAQMRKFALEASDSVIDKILGFIKYIVEQCTKFIRDVWRVLTGRQKLNFSYTDTTTIDINSIFNADIVADQHFAVFYKGGKLTVDTMNKAIQDMQKIAFNVEHKCKELKASAKLLKANPGVLEKTFSAGVLELTPSTDWPGRSYFQLDDNNVATIGFDEAAGKAASGGELTIGRMSQVSSMVTSAQKTNESLITCLKELEASLEIIDKEAQAISKARSNMSYNAKSDDTITDAEVKQEQEKSPLAMNAFVKATSVLIRGITGASVKFLDYETKALASINKQLAAK